MVTSLLLLALPSAASAACLVVEGSWTRIIAQHADSIILARVVGRAPSGLIRLTVLEVYRGEPEATIELENGAISCYALSQHMGDRVVVARGSEPEWGPFTMGWFETASGGWQHFGPAYTTLSELLQAMGVARDLPDTAASLVDGEAGAEGVTPAHAGWLTAWAVLTLGLALRQWSRRPT
jgi:hypothetical protein